MIGFYLLAVIGTYFSVGLAAAADMIFHGQQATVGDGLAVARSRFSQIAAGPRSRPRSASCSARWRTRAASAQIVGRVLAIGWSLITFLAVPVIALEGTGPVRRR